MEGSSKACNGEAVFFNKTDYAEGSFDPAKAGQIGAESDALRETGTLDAHSKKYIFENFELEIFEAADCVVGSAPDHVECTSTEGVSGARVGDLP